MDEVVGIVSHVQGVSHLELRQDLRVFLYEYGHMGRGLVPDLELIC
jgi:hypothetical protein